MSTGKKSRSRAASTSRFCPMCGTFTNAARCPVEGAITVAHGGIDLANAPLRAGDVVDGRYRVLEPIGQGSFGYVFRAEQTRTGQPVALKVLHVQGQKREATQRFVKEGRALATLRHSATVRIFDVGATAVGAPYIAMEFIDGPNLEQLLARSRAGGGALSEAQALDIVVPVLASLTEAHGLGLIHRDLKPANILLTEVADEPLVVKVVDFGVVRTQDSQLTTRQSSIGTPRYMSPEQCRGEVVDARSDLYSLGCLLFEAVCGAPPFDSKSHVDTMFLQMSAEVPDLRACAITPVSDAFVAVVRRSLAKDPADRFPTASAMRAALRAIRADAWRNVPVTSMHAMMGVGPGVSWRSNVPDAAAATKDSTHAGVRSGTRGTAVSPVAATDTNLNLQALKATPARPGHPSASSPAPASGGRGVPSGGAAAPATATPRFRARASIEHAGEHVLPPNKHRSHLSEPTPSAWELGAAVAEVGERVRGPRMPFDSSPSQEVVALPSRRRLAAAIAAAEAEVAAQAQIKSEAPTRVESPVGVAPPREDVRHVQIAPAARVPRKSDWARGTLLGTGLPPDDDRDDG